MRVVSQPLCGLGFLSLAALGASPHAQQLQKVQREVRPVEQVSIAPTVSDWNQLVQLQASLPRLTPVVDQANFATLELPVLEIPLDGKRVLPNEPASGVEKLGPCTGFSSEPPIGAGFDSELDVPDGMGFSFIPPNVAGGVGPQHLMTMLTNQVLIQDRTGGSLSVIDTSVFWSPAGANPASPTVTYGRVYYDDLHGRWLASARNGITSTGSTTILFAISHTDDPTGMWDYYAITADPGAASFADWVLLGYNDTWISLTANMFTLGGASLGSKMWVIDTASAVMLGGPINVFTFATGFMGAVHGSGGTSPHPARTFDGDPTLWLVNNSFTSSGVFLWQLTRITGTVTPAVSGIAGSPFGGTTSFCFSSTNWSGTQRSMSQIGDARFITPFSARVASVAVRNGKIWIANSGGLPGPATNASPTSNGVVWHELDPTLPFPGAPAAPGTMVLQSGAITNGTNTMSMYPSIAVNCADDVLVGFSNGDATRSPRACYTFRLGTDAANFMGPIGQLKAGESVYWKNFGVGATAQYGLYSSAAVDPNDDKTLWTLQEYADQRVATPGVDNDSRWGTYWGRFGDCEDLPVVTDEPDDISGACVGDAASFMVVASSSSALTYQWRKDGVDISGANADTYSIPVTVSGDAGSYDVVICGCGQVTSMAATLSFAGAAVTTQPISLNVAPGNPASFMVAGTGSGTLMYQWSLNGNPISGAMSDTYSIASVTVADYGNYTCTITDDCGPATSDVATLHPLIESGKHQPGTLSLHIFTSPKPQTACVGSVAMFEVEAYPAGVTYLWRKGGVVIVPNETNSTLVLSPVGVGDVGNYDVQVSLGNQMKTSASAALTVIDVPVITVQPSPGSQTKNVGQSVTYSVTATGDGPISYQWRFKPNGQGAVYNDIPNETDSTLTLDPLIMANSGRYRCVVSNSCGGVGTNQVQLIVIP